MADTYTLVDLIATIADGRSVPLKKTAPEQTAAENVLSVTFAGGQVGVLDLSLPRSGIWASVLRSLQELSRPAYVEIDRPTQLIVQLLQPKLQPVGEIVPFDTGANLRVELLDSHALHVLNRRNPQFDALLKMLRTAQKQQTRLWVTETLDTHEILDVRVLQFANK